MILTALPEKLEDWDIAILNSLVNLRDIESETFDFKGPDFKELANHFCAFANYSKDYMVLGIKEDKCNGYPIGFKKVGFDRDREDWVRNEVNNAMVNVEPLLIVNIKHLYDNNRLYPVLNIEGKDVKKPYSQFFIRIGASTTPASRTTVLNLYSNLIIIILGVSAAKEVFYEKNMKRKCC